MFKKILTTIIMIALWTAYYAVPTFAADLTITCDDGGCVTSPAPEAALFGEFEDLNYDIKPGENIRRKITAINNGGESCVLRFGSSVVNFENPPDFSSKLWSVIRDLGGDIFGISSGDRATGAKTLEDILDGDLSSLGIIPSGDSHEYEWIVTFDPATGNEYQRARIEFDFDLNFECGNPDVTPTPTPTITPTPTPTPSTSPNPSDPPGIGGACTAQQPVGPLTLSVQTGGQPGPNSALLTWNAVSPVTHYGIQFGTSPGTYVYGAANIGNTTSYVVQGLTGGVTYYFQVIAFNDCASISSNEASGTPNGNPNVPLNPPAPFVPGEIQGVEEEVEQPEIGGVENEGDIAGAAEGCCPIIDPSWWIVLMLQTGLLIGYLLRKAMLGKEEDQWLVFPIALTLGAIVVHWLMSGYFVGQLGYAKHTLTDWFWLLSIVDTGLLSLLFGWVRKE